jgi:hypothetical protein
MPQLEPQQLIALNVIGFLMAAVVWLVLAGCTVRYFYLFFVRTREFAALPDAYILRDALRDRTRIARRGALLLKTGAFVGTLVGLFHAAAAALSWIPRSWIVLGDEQLWVGFFVAALLAFIANVLIHSHMMRLARRYADLAQRVEGPG